MVFPAELSGAQLRVSGYQDLLQVQFFPHFSVNFASTWHKISKIYEKNSSGYSGSQKNSFGLGRSSGWVKFRVGSWPIPSLQDYSYPFEDIIFRFRASLVQEGVQRTIQSRKLVKKFNDDNGEVLLGNTLVLIFFDSGSTKVLLCQ